MQWSLVFAVVVDVERNAEDPVEGDRALQVGGEQHQCADPGSHTASISVKLGA